MNLEVGQEESVENDYFQSRMRKQDIKAMKKAKASLALLDTRRGIFLDDNELFALVFSI